MASYTEEATDELTTEDSPLMFFGMLFSENIAVTDELFRIYGYSVLEELSVAGATAYDWVVHVQERLEAGETLAGIIHATLALSDRVTMDDLAGIARLFAVADAVQVADTPDGTAAKLLAFADSLLIAGLAESRMDAIQAVAEFVVAGTEAEAQWALAAAEELGVTGEGEALARAIMAVIDALEVASVAEGQFVISLVVGEAMGLASEASATGAFIAAVEDGLTIGGVLRFPDGEEYQCWVTNTESFAAWQYGNFPFNSFCFDGERFLGRTDTALYRLELGDDDDGEPIQSCISTGLSNMGTSFYKSIPNAFIAMTGDGELMLYTNTTDRKGRLKRNWYRVNAKAGGAITQKEVKLKRGVISVHWQFELENIDGGMFNVDMMQVTPAVLKRR